MLLVAGYRVSWYLYLQGWSVPKSVVVQFWWYSRIARYHGEVIATFERCTYRSDRAGDRDAGKAGTAAEQRNLPSAINGTDAHKNQHNKTHFWAFLLNRDNCPYSFDFSRF